MTERELLKELLERCRSDIAFFAQYFFPHFLTKPSAPFHKEIDEELNKAHKYLAIECFRGGAKSTKGLLIKPIHFALFKPIGDITLISKSESFVLNEINRKIRHEIEFNKKLKPLLQKTEKWSDSYFVVRNLIYNKEVAFEGLGIGGQLRGGRRGLIVLDDLEDEESAISEEQRDKLKRRIGKEIAPKLLPEGEMCYFGTPVHQLCYLHQIIRTPDNGWVKRIYPAYKSSEQKAGNEAWAEMFPHSRLQEFKNTWGTTYFSSEYLCNPITDESVPIKEEHLRFWTKYPDKYSCVISVDPAYSEDNKADWKVASVIAIDENLNRYLIEYVRTHEPIGEFQDQIIALYKRYKSCCTAIGIPNSGVEKAFYESFERKCLEGKLELGVIQELKNVTTSANGLSFRNKKSRTVAALQPLFEQGKYYIHPDHLEARDELLTIGQSLHDDIVDTLTYAEQLITPVFFDMGNTSTTLQDDTRERGVDGYGSTY